MQPCCVVNYFVKAAHGLITAQKVKITIIPKKNSAILLHSKEIVTAICAIHGRT